MERYQRTVSLRLLLPALSLLVLFAACGQNPVDPEGFTGQTGGCGDFQVYKFNAGQTDAVVIRGKASSLSIDRTPREFALPNPALDVRIERFSAPALMPYCNDVVDGNLKLLRTWTAESGRVEITAGDTLDVQPWFTTYTLSVSLRDALLRDQFGEQVFIKELNFGEVTVGWLPG